MAKNECGSVWEYHLFDTFIRHKCKLPAGHSGSHEGFAASWTREHVELVPWEHPIPIPMQSDTDTNTEETSHGV